MAAGMKGVHVPYKSSAEALTEVLAGRVDYYFSPIGLAAQHLKADKLVALAVSGKARSSALPYAWLSLLNWVRLSSGPSSSR